MSLPDDVKEALEKVAAGRAYQREHFPLGDPGKFVGHVPAPEWDAALDQLIEWVLLLEKERGGP